MKQWQTARWLLPTLITSLLVVVACTGIVDDRPATTLTTPALVLNLPTPSTGGDTASGGTPDLLVVIVTPTLAVNGETADASAEEGVTASEESGGEEGAASEAAAPNETAIAPVATGEASGEAAAEGDLGNAAPNALEMSETELISTGEQVYTQECASCHQLSGEGTSSYPALNHNAVVTDEEPTAVISNILLGRGEMPAFADTLSTKQIAAVASYVRNTWDNNAAVVMPVQVSQVAEGGSAAPTTDETRAEDGTMEDAATEDAGVEDASAENGVTTAEEGVAAQNTPAPTAAITTTATVTATTATLAPATAAPTGTAATPSATDTMTATTAPEAAGSDAAAATPPPPATGTMTTTATPAAAAAPSTPAPDDPNQAENETTGAEGSVQISEEEEATEAGVPRQAESVVEPPEEDNMTAMDEAAEEATSVSPEELIDMGETLYTMNCAACHQAEGQGVANAYPPLAGNAFVTTEDPTPVIQILITGRAGMPRFSDDLSAREIAAIVSYVRNAWGNEAVPVSPDQVRSVRESAESGGH